MRKATKDEKKFIKGIKSSSKNKTIRKTKNVSKDFSKTSNNEVSRFIKIIVVLLVLVAVFWIITMFVTNKNKKSSTTEATIQYSKILVGSILNREQDSYYVLVEVDGDTNISNYQTTIDSYEKKDEHLNFYYVDLNSGFNSKFVSKKANLNISKISDIKFNETTLLLISNGKITKNVVGNDAITKYLSSL